MQQYINIGLNIESFFYVLIIIMGGIALFLFLKLDWKRYGLLFVIASFVGNVLCYIFVKLEFYSFPYLLFPKITIMPLTAITLSFPILVLLGVRYSPEKWGWKIPFYWTLIHVGIFLETLALNQTRLIEYNYKWDTWDSYTWWWIYFLIFEWIGSTIIPNNLRKPIDFRYLQFGRIGWMIIHFVLIVTIFLAGYYLGTLKVN